jgi:hypothetical protein
MDDYRDLVTVSLVLLCAGIMLVAGQLYIEHHATSFEREGIETPSPPPMVSRAPTEKLSPPARDSGSKRPS